MLHLKSRKALFCGHGFYFWFPSLRDSNFKTFDLQSYFLLLNTVKGIPKPSTMDF